MSPPMRGRGLKRIRYGINCNCMMSPPMRGRGLKPPFSLDYAIQHSECLLGTPFSFPVYG